MPDHQLRLGMTNLRRIAVLPGASLSTDALERLSELCECDPVLLPEADDCGPGGVPEELLESVDALLCGWRDRVTASVLCRLPRLRYIGVRGTSTHRIDLDYAASHGIAVRPIYNYGDIGTAEFVVEQMLVWARSARHERGLALRELSGARLGLVGYGGVARRVAKVADAMGMRVHFFTPRPRTNECHARWCTIDTLLADSDIVSFHTPAYSPVTSASQLSRIQPDALVIVTTLGLPFAAGDFATWQRSHQGRVVLDLCATQGAPEEVLDLPGVEVAGLFAARTAESVTRAERALLADLQAFKAHVESD